MKGCGGIGPGAARLERRAGARLASTGGELGDLHRPVSETSFWRAGGLWPTVRRGAGKGGVLRLVRDLGRGRRARPRTAGASKRKCVGCVRAASVR